MLPLLLQDAPQGDASPFASLFPMVLILVLFFFMIIRPQQKQRKAEEKTRNELAKGDRVVTSSGVIARVSSVKPIEVVLDLDGSARMTVLKSAITQRLDPESEADKK